MVDRDQKQSVQKFGFADLRKRVCPDQLSDIWSGIWEGGGTFFSFLIITYNKKSNFEKITCIHLFKSRFQMERTKDYIWTYYTR